jgi:hypothetical protein
MTPHTVISRTHFRKKYDTKSDEWQWFWRTENASGHHHRLIGALNEFFTQEPDNDWELGQPHIPDGYAMEKIDDTHHIVYRYEMC